MHNMHTYMHAYIPYIRMCVYARVVVVRTCVCCVCVTCFVYVHTYIRMHSSCSVSHHEAGTCLLRVVLLEVCTG